METDKNIRLDELSLDNLGRVILSDAIIEQLEKCENLLFSGGANLNCGGSANGGCSNARCDGSLNGSCTNSMSCTSAANMLACQNPDDGVPVNRSCV